MEAFLEPLGMLALGLSLVFLALAFFGEYRKLFFRNPLSVVSTEVFTQLAHLGSLGQIGIVLFVAGAILVVVSCVMLVVILVAVLSGQTVGIAPR